MIRACGFAVVVDIVLLTEVLGIDVYDCMNEFAWENGLSNLNQGLADNGLECKSFVTQTQSIMGNNSFFSIPKLAGTEYLFSKRET